MQYIGSHANPRGDGMEWLAEVPMTLVLLALVLPALIVGFAGWWSARAAKLAAGFAAAALDFVLWTELLREFTQKTAH